MRTCLGLLTQMVVDLFLAVLDLCLGWCELLGSVLYIPSMIVSFVDSLLLSLANNSVFLLLYMFLLCPNGCSIVTVEFSFLYWDYESFYVQGQ